jgi:hypothetical protein
LKSKKKTGEEVRVGIKGFVKRKEYKVNCTLKKEMLGLFFRHGQQEDWEPEFYYLPPPQCSRLYDMQHTIQKLNRILGHGEALVGTETPDDSTNFSFQLKKMDSPIPKEQSR